MFFRFVDADDDIIVNMNHVMRVFMARENAIQIDMVDGRSYLFRSTDGETAKSIYLRVWLMSRPKGEIVDEITI